MPSFEMQLGVPSIDAMSQIIRKWISAIEMEADQYGVETKQAHDPSKEYGSVAVTYRQRPLFYIDFYKKHITTAEGKRGLQGRFTVRRRDEGRSLMKPGAMTLHVDDRWSVNYNEKHVGFFDALEDVLPIRDDDQVRRITQVLQISPDQIKLDSYQKRYLIDALVPDLQWKEDPAPERFYKYVPLEVFHKMLLNGTFRMNSIISQSDTEESFYLGNLLCGDYEDEFKRFAGVLSEHTVLISSFTTEYDDREMWGDYAGDGRGVCLGFSLTGGRRLHQVQYVNPQESSLSMLKEQVMQLRKEGINVHFSAVDDRRRFVKNLKYSTEKEWRLIVEDYKDVDNELYENGTRCVTFKDFKFDGRELPEIGLRLDSVLIGPNQPSGADNFPLLAQRAHQRLGEEIVVNRSKVKML